MTFVLAFILLGLSCLPCADGGNKYADRVKSEISQSASHQDSKDHNDQCPPFCSCSCCSSLSVNTGVPAAVPHHIPASEDMSLYSPPTITDISLPVWQPPQLKV